MIFFDVDGVLIHGYHARPELRQCWDENLPRDFGIDREIFKQNFIMGPFVTQVLVGQKDLAEALNDFFTAKNLSISADRLIDYWLKNDSHINHDLLAVVKKLKQEENVRLFIATNQEHNRARYLMNNLGFGEYFDDIFYSARVGHLKPTAQYFEKIIEALAISTNDTPVLIDDTPAVVHAARQLGWQAIEYTQVADLKQHEILRPFV